MKRTTWILILVALAATAGLVDGRAAAQDSRYAGLEPLGPPPIPLDNVQTPE